MMVGGMAGSLRFWIPRFLFGQSGCGDHGSFGRRGLPGRFARIDCDPHRSQGATVICGPRCFLHRGRNRVTTWLAINRLGASKRISEGVSEI